jgi:hypothetical protein
MSIEQTYLAFCNYLSQLSNLNDFKYSKIFQEILEHVNYEQGIEYLKLIKEKTNITNEQIFAFCEINDKIGGGDKLDFKLIKTSPSNFRYIFHSYLILNHIKNLGINNIDIVEIGGGYGGLCLAMNFFSNMFNIVINKYNIIDLPPVKNLQQAYLSQHKLNFSLQTHNAFEYGSNVEEKNVFLISNYSFSEISDENQKNYIKTLFPKVKHGFFTWNFIPVYDFGFEYTEEVEYPMTGDSKYNKYIRF